MREGAGFVRAMPSVWDDWNDQIWSDFRAISFDRFGHSNW